MFLLLTLLCALLYLPGLSAIPPTDRDESRFMQATKQMLETGDWVHIKFQDEPRNKKPAGIYWMQAVAVSAFGQELNVAWPYRVPSAIAAWLAVLATAYAGRKLFNPATGLAAGAVLATTFIVVVEAHIAKTDAALLAATTVAMAMLGRIYTEPTVSWPSVLAFWAALGVGILLKGPVILLVAGATILTLCVADRDFKGLKTLQPLAGLPLMLAIVLPWLIAVSGGGTETAQGNFLSEAVLNDLLPKLIGGHESHGAPPGAYLLAGLLTAWPWSLLAPLAVIAAWKQRTVPAVRFCLAWLIPAWIVFEIVPTKLPHYTMPLYPALALLIGYILSDAQAFKNGVTGKAALAWRIVWAVAPLALAGGVIFAARQYGPGVDAITIAAATFAGLTALFVIFGIARVTARTTVIVCAALAVLFAVTLTEGVIPRLTHMAISPRLVLALKEHATAQPAPAALAEFHEPSAVFLLGTDTLLTNSTGAAQHVLAHPGAVAVVPKQELDTVQSIAGDRPITVLDSIGGYNYSRGRWLRLAVITAGTPAEPTPTEPGP
ncbi:MAG: glycosyltransferase family 39 protein [Rhodospirillaceae bacterium]|nr:glycosyltransferase family 39 protein [Rhodospirillaceae bacterium]